MVGLVFSWDTLLNKILPDYIKGMVCVLQSSTGQTFTYIISGDVVTFLGEGDHHNIKYNEEQSKSKGGCCLYQVVHEPLLCMLE